MKITVIGSSHGVPEPKRKCTSFLVEVEDKLYFIDMGTSGIDPLVNRGLRPEAVQAVFITHMHGDHTAGLIPFVDLLTWYFRTADPEIFLPSMDIAQALTGWLQVTTPPPLRPIRYRQVTEGEIFFDGTARVTAFPTRHCPNAHAFLFEAEGKRILFAFDLKHPGTDFPRAEGPIDLLICEAAHFAATEYLPVLEDREVKQLAVTHYYEPFVPSVLQLKDALARQGIPVTVAMDDMVFSL